MNERIKLPAQEWLGYDPERGDLYGYTFEQMREFAALVAEQEREECAKVADRQNGDDEEDSKSCVWSKAARHIAAAIRARGSK